MEQRDSQKTWRFRLPHAHESIQTWKTILENRNLTFTLLQQKFLFSDPASVNENYHKEMDILWNKLQLAKVSRKHGLP
jgi:hypothetical protein